MAKPNQATKAKRDRERARQEHQQEKQLKRGQRGDQKLERARLIAEGIDPDLEGIVAGPQPPYDETV